MASSEIGFEWIEDEERIEDEKSSANDHENYSRLRDFMEEKLGYTPDEFLLEEVELEPDQAEEKTKTILNLIYESEDNYSVELSYNFEDHKASASIQRNEEDGDQLPEKEAMIVYSSQGTRTKVLEYDDEHEFLEK